MAPISIMFLLFFLNSMGVRAQTAKPKLIELGSSLSPTNGSSSWVSPSGHFAFGFYPQDTGFAVGVWLVGQSGKTVVWTANRDDPPVSSNTALEFTRNGKLLLRTGPGEEVSIADVAESSASASMLDSGNFVLFGDNSSFIIWQSFQHPTDTLLGGQNLSNILSSSKTESSAIGATLDVDGVFRLYSHSFGNSNISSVSIMWSAFKNPCDVKGLCGVNGLCSSNGTNANCSCVPGFVSINREKTLSENAMEEFTLRSFSYNDLEKATDGFREELGRGPFGAVYKGTIAQGNQTIAVKRLEKVVEEGEREFQAEMTIIGRTHHRNLVRLLGFCMQGSKKLLVYEYMSNGSLADLLFNGEKRPIWRERVRIALDVARGIFYLHEECEVHIIHGDIKPKNILLDDSWTAKLSDFRLARLLRPNQTGTISRFGGSSRGYSAPERQKRMLISVEADVYSFGVVLLEIVCCRSNLDINVSTGDEILLCSWVYSCFVARELEKLVEGAEVNMKTLERMVKVGLLCIQDDPSLRPTMKNVILMLEGTVDVPVPPSPTPLGHFLLLHKFINWASISNQAQPNPRATLGLKKSVLIRKRLDDRNLLANLCLSFCFVKEYPKKPHKLIKMKVVFG
ncbi:unnamed protein product, partial [Vitis vinifera]